MNTPKVDVTYLQNHDPDAWSRLLRKVLATDDVAVTAVTAEPLRTAKSGPYNHFVLPKMEPQFPPFGLPLPLSAYDRAGGLAGIG